MSSTKRTWKILATTKTGTTMKIDPLTGQVVLMPELEQFAGMQSLDTAADLFEASPRDSFSRVEIVRTLRALKGHLFDADCVMAYEIALSSAPLPLPPSTPS
jgi:hypothetical protein